jgi:hypothetical protein
MARFSAFFEDDISRKIIMANTIKELKQKASVICNRKHNAVDTMQVFDIEYKRMFPGAKNMWCTWTRRNRITPRGAVQRGTWQ